jgi:hypothetical protein
MGAPGGSGAYGKGLFTAAQIGASEAVTVGTGGTTGSGGSGGNGGASPIGVLASAPGGVGGGVLNNTAPGGQNGNGAVTAAPTGASIAQVLGNCVSQPTPCRRGAVFLALAAVHSLVRAVHLRK